MKPPLKVLALFDAIGPTTIDQDLSAELKTEDWKTEANVLTALAALGYTTEHLAIFDNLDLLRQKLEACSVEIFELLLPVAGKVVVSTDRIIDIRQLARQHFGDDSAKALFRAPPVVAGSAPADIAPEASPDAGFAANAARGTVKSLANGYGMAKRKDGLGDVQFMANQVTAPGFDFLEVGDELRFDVVQVASGKWFAQRVVRM